MATFDLQRNPVTCLVSLKFQRKGLALTVLRARGLPT